MPQTDEGTLELFRETKQLFRELTEQRKKISRKISSLGSHVGDMVEKNGRSRN